MDASKAAAKWREGLGCVVCRKYPEDKSRVRGDRDGEKGLMLPYQGLAATRGKTENLLRTGCSISCEV